MTYYIATFVQLSLIRISFNCFNDIKVGNMKNGIFKSISEQSPDAMYLIRDSHFEDCNDALLNMMKYESKDHFYGTSPSDFSPVFQPDQTLSSEKAKRMMEICMNEGSHRFEWMYKKSDGENFPIDVSLTKIDINGEVYVHALLKDITDKQFLRKTVDEQNLELRQLVDGLNESAIVSKTDSNGYITFVNKKFCDISGYSQEELVGHSHNLVRHPAMEKDFFTNLWKTLKQQEMFKAIIRNRTKSGEDYYVDTTIIPIADTKGKVYEYLSIRYDVTKLQQQNNNMQEIINATVKKQEEQQLLLFQQSKMAAMGEMIAMIAHQWRQPISVISTVVSKLKIGIALGRTANDSLEKDLDQISQSTEYMSETIEDFRSFFKPNKKKTSVNLSELMDKSLSMLASVTYKNSIEIVKNYENIEPVNTHANELLQVLLNILKNAIDALVMNEIHEPKIFISILRDREGCCKVLIKDNGGGIEESALAKVFEPYFTTKDEKGTGLGLHISKMIIEEHCEGRLIMENLDKGLQCTITL